MQPACVAVAYSGGRDSTALLHATAVVARDNGGEVLALHVHHGLSPHADAWLAHGEAQCARWRRRGLPVTFIAHRVSGRPERGESVEAWARGARYAALRQMALAHGAQLVLLAHHRRDQAETLLIQALRGAGVAGLSGMPRVVERGGITWARPWLDQSHAAIDAYVRQQRLTHIEDDSNADPRFARNRLRLEVWPALMTAFPNAEASLADAAQWAQEAAAALDELAVIDLATVADEHGVELAAWSTLSAPRRSNSLRAWLADRLGAAPSASLVRRLMHELPAAKSARWPVDGGELRAYRGILRHAETAEAPPQARATASPKAPDTTPSADSKPRPESHLSIRRAGTYALPGWGGRLRVERVKENGVPLAWLAHLELRPRQGSDRFQAGLGRPPRSLKKQYQAAGVPSWSRDGPLLWSGGQLVFVPGLGLDARVIGLPGQALARFEWLPIE